ncbi:MAG: carbon storage regulator CsrA [Ignavibacteriales bacterium]|nr:MAG: carbon storage regulator CsrA [Ignavibacteriales bacterium]
MLILTRKPDDEIIINSNIRVKILSVNDNQVRLGIEAPAEIEILRGELYEKVKENAIKASQQSKQKLADVSKLKVNKMGS